MKNNKLLLIPIIVLFITYVLSFINFEVKRKSVNSALINPKNVTNIQEISFEQNGKNLVLTKDRDNWFVNSIPADKNKIENFLFDFSKVQKMYKISDNKAGFDTYGFNQENQFIVNYAYNNNISSILFGNNDFSKSSRYFMNGKTTTIYEIDNSLDKYLNLHDSYWIEPLLVSQNILGKIKVENIQSIKIIYENSKFSKSNSDENWYESVNKLLDLRHGGQIIYDEFENLELSLKIELGNKNSILMEFYRTENESEINLKAVYFENLKNQKYETAVKISSWTYNKIKEIML